MIKVIGVRFRTAGKIYFFDPADFDIKKGDHVIVETARGIEYGTVVGGIRQVADDEIIQPLKPVLRIATERDDSQEADNKRREKEAYKLCLEKIREHGLDMKLIDAEYTFDNNKVLFYFTSDGRIDFRELVKDLASIFKTRIELRQIGVRDETKMVGGIGMCGRPLCCHTHLSDFIPVSIKMAKEQNLSLNPTKISGVCGRLMCCLKHEEETYEELNRNLPHIGDRVTCPDGTQGEVSSVNVLRQLVKVVVENGDSKEICEYKAEDIRFVRRGHRQVKAEVSSEELRALELMEKQDKLDNQDGDGKPSNNQKKEREERRPRGEREERADRSERKSRADREERGENTERKKRSEREDRVSREERENTERRNRTDREERGENAERKNRGEREERGSREERENTERRNRNDREDRGENTERKNRSERAERGNREERENTERKNREERGENSERRNRGDNAERRNRGERKERFRKEAEGGENAEVKTEENSAPEGTQEDAAKEAFRERKGNFDKKRRFDKNKDRSKDRAEQEATGDKPQTADKQPSEGASAVKAENAEQKENGERTEFNRMKGYYNRNRRRNRPEGAKEQHES